MHNIKNRKIVPILTSQDNPVYPVGQAHASTVRTRPKEVKDLTTEASWTSRMEADIVVDVKVARIRIIRT